MPIKQRGGIEASAHLRGRSHFYTLDTSKYSKSEVGFHFNIFCIEEKVMQKYNGYHTRLVFGNLSPVLKSSMSPFSRLVRAV